MTGCHLYALKSFFVLGFYFLSFDWVMVQCSDFIESFLSTGLQFHSFSSLCGSPFCKTAMFWKFCDVSFHLLSFDWVSGRLVSLRAFHPLSSNFSSLSSAQLDSPLFVAHARQMFERIEHTCNKYENKYWTIYCNIYCNKYFLPFSLICSTRDRCLRELKTHVEKFFWCLYKHLSLSLLMFKSCILLFTGLHELLPSQQSPTAG